MNADKKFTSLYASGFSTIVQQKNNATSYAQIIPTASNQSTTTQQVKPVPVSQKNIKKARAGSMQNDSSFDSPVSFLTQKLLDKQLDYWIVFLSHPDNDHINYLGDAFTEITNKKLNLKVILIAGGEWFNSKSTKSMDKVKSLVDSNKDKVYAFFPFDLGRCNYSDIVESGEFLKNFQKPILHDTQGKPSIYVEDFYGTLDILLLNKGFVPHVKKTEIKPIWEFLNFSTQTDLMYQAIVSEIFRKIYIWNLNYPTGNDNARSLVWSHAVDDIKWTLEVEPKNRTIE